MSVPARRGGYEDCPVPTLEFVGVTEVVEDVEDDLEDCADLLAPIEREPAGERRPDDGISREGVQCACEVARLHRGTERELGRSACERGHGRLLVEIC